MLGNLTFDSLVREHLASRPLAYIPTPPADKFGILTPL